MAKDDGIAMISAGEGRSWFFGGKTEVALKRDFSLSASVKTEVSLGIKTDLTVAIANSISLSSKIEAVRGLKLSYGKTDSFETKEKGSFKAMDAYNGSVGHDAVSLAKVKTLRTALSVLLGAQATATMTVAALAIAEKVNSPKDDIFNFPDSGVNMNAVINLITGISTLGSALYLFFRKIMEAEIKNDPACVFSMDKTGTCFLGIKKGTVSSVASGLTIDQSKIVLNGPTKSADYIKPPLGGIVLGMAGRYSKLGAAAPARDNELKITETGVKAQGKNLSVAVDNMVKISGDTFVALQVGEKIPESSIMCNKSGLLLQGGVNPVEKSSMAIKPGSLSALVGGPTGASLNMTSKEASLGAAGNNITLSASGATFQFGATSVKLDAMGFSIGSNLSVLNPGPPALTFAGLQAALQNVTKLNTETGLKTKELQVSQQKQDTLEMTQDKLNHSLVTARNQVDAATKAAEAATATK